MNILILYADDWRYNTLGCAGNPVVKTPTLDRLADEGIRFTHEHATIQNIKFIPSSQALVRKDWKYFYWPDFQTEQLFNLRMDPIEEEDLIADPAQRYRLSEMRGRFAKLKAAAQ